jgi:hypothetical protein
MHNWNIFVAWMNHEQTQTHKIHQGPNFGESTTFPFLIFFVPGHEPCTQISFCPKTSKLGISKFSKLGLSKLWKHITLCAKLRLRWGPKQSYCRDPSFGRECERVWGWWLTLPMSPILGVGVLVVFQTFREQLQRSKHLALRSSLCCWKVIEE